MPLLKQREQHSALKHPAGLLLIAITHNYTNAHREQEVTRQEQQQQAAKRGKLAPTTDQLLRAQDAAWQAVCAQFLEAQPVLLTAAIALLRAHKDPVVTFCYEPTSRPLNHYHAHPPVAGAGHSWLVTRFPAPCEEVTPSLTDRLVAREATLGASPVSEVVVTK